MRLRVIQLTVLLALCLPLTASCDDDKNKSTSGSASSDTLDADKLAPGRFTGTLLSLPAPNSSFSVEVPTNHLELKNPNQPANPAVANAAAAYSRDLQRVNQLQVQVQQAGNSKAYQSAMQQLQNAIAQAQKSQAAAQKLAQDPKNSPYKVVTEKKTVEFHTGDDIVVRYLKLPMDYDDKGQLKKYTSEEITKLKGSDPKVPGYEAKIEDLKTGGNVLIVLESASSKAPASKEGEKSAENKEASQTHHTVVKMILILNVDDSASSTSLVSPKKGNK